MAAAAGVLSSVLAFPVRPSSLEGQTPREDQGDARNGVGTSSDGSLAGLAVPDASGVSSDGGLAAEGAGVLGVLGDLHLLHLLSQGGTVTVRSTVSMSLVVCHVRSVCGRAAPAI